MNLEFFKKNIFITIDLINIFIFIFILLINIYDGHIYREENEFGGVAYGSLSVIELLYTILFLFYLIIYNLYNKKLYTIIFLIMLTIFFWEKSNGCFKYYRHISS